MEHYKAPGEKLPGREARTQASRPIQLHGMGQFVCMSTWIKTATTATEVTKPEEETVATDALDELHVTEAPLIVAPFWSLTVAVSCCV